MNRPTARALVGAAAALALLCAGPAVAGDRDDRGKGGKGGKSHDRAARPTTYELPGENVFPEGITVRGRDFYVGSTTDGTVYRGRRGDPTLEVFLPGEQDGRTTAIGLASTSRLLLVAGGGTGDVFVYDRRSGEFLGAFSNDPEQGPTFLNDLRVSPRGDVYVTDSARDLVYVIPADALASADADEVGELQVFSAASEGDPQGRFNANGIAIANGGRYLIVVQSDTGALFRISTRTGEIEQIEVTRGSLGAGDGLELRGRTLYVVSRTDDFSGIVELRLAGRLDEARVRDRVTDETFVDPTTLALTGGRALVVNSQFGARGAGAEPQLPFTVSSVRLR